VAPVPSYAVMKWKGGTLYAGPADSAMAFPSNMLVGSTMLMCDRAEALRLAMNGKVEV